MYCILRTGQISAQEFMTFMISRETENVDSAQEVEEAFQAITAGGERPYVTKEELYQVNMPLVVATYLSLCRHYPENKQITA